MKKVRVLHTKKRQTTMWIPMFPTRNQKPKKQCKKDSKEPIASSNTVENVPGTSGTLVQDTNSILRFKGIY